MIISEKYAMIREKYTIISWEYNILFESSRFSEISVFMQINWNWLITRSLSILTLIWSDFHPDIELTLPYYETDNNPYFELSSLLNRRSYTKQTLTLIWKRPWPLSESYFDPPSFAKIRTEKFVKTKIVYFQLNDRIISKSNDRLL